MTRFKTRSYWFSAATTAVLMAAVAHAADWDKHLADSAHGVIVGDWNGDQHSDVWLQAKRPEDEHAAMITAVKSAALQRWKEGFLGKAWSRKDINAVVGDFNGDLSSDILLQSITPALMSELVLTEATGQIGIPTQSIGDWHLGLRWDNSNSRLLVGDFNGDSRDDLFLHGKDKNRHGLALADEDGQFQELAFDFDNLRNNLDWSDKNVTLTAADFDGDGKAELLMQPSISNGTVYVIGGQYHQQALSEITQQWSAQLLGFDWSFNRHKAVVGDFNGDGKDDVFLLATSKTDSSAYLPSNGNGFDKVQEKIDVIPNLEKLKDVVVADFDADGIDELLVVFDDKKNPVRLLLADGARRARLESILRDMGLLAATESLSLLVGQQGSTTSTTTATTITSATDAPISTLMSDPCNVPEPPASCEEGGGGGVYTDPIPTESESAYKPFQEFGIVNGTFRVDESGAATYSYPISTLPGSGGVAPKIALSYNSSGGNGPVGMGWNISGLSSVTRCRRTKETDNVDGSIQFDNYDEYCLDGQRLKLVGNNRLDVGPWNFTTENDSLARIWAAGGTFASPNVFFVERKDGSTSTFGATDDAKVEVADIATGAPIAGKTLAWSINRFEDKATNYILFKYTESFGQQLISAIEYTGNTRATPIQGPYATLKFDYETRTDERTFYAYGGINRRTLRLKAIRSLDGGIDNSAGIEIRRFDLSYAPLGRSPVSRLEFIQECVSATCLPAIQFKWNVGANRINATRGSAGGSGYRFSHRYRGGKFGDFNGDGYTDLGWLTSDSSSDGKIEYFWFTTSINEVTSGNRHLLNSDIRLKLPHKDSRSWHLIDYNGDGKTDLLSPFCTADKAEILGLYSCTGYITWGVTLAKADGSFDTAPVAKWKIPNQIDIGISYSSDTQNQLTVADYNGDGLPDILFPNSDSSVMISMLGKPGVNGHTCAKPGSDRIYCYALPKKVILSLSTPVSNESLTSLGLVTPYLYDQKTVDMDGDGFADLVLDVGTSIPIPNGQCSPATPSYPFCPPFTKRRTGIFLARKDNSSAGFGFYEIPLPAELDIPLYSESMHLVDMNGDGLTDTLYLRTVSENGQLKNRWVYNLNTGAGLGVEKSTGVDTVYKTIDLLDLNNDGLLDFLYQTSAGSHGTPYYVRFQNGDGSFSSAVQTGYLGPLYHDEHSNLFVDLNADSIPDVLHLFHDDSGSDTHDGQDLTYGTDVDLARNTIKEIVSGVGNRTVIEYKPLTKAAYTRKTDGAAQQFNNKSPVLDLYAPMYVVSSAKSSAPTAASSAFSVDTNALAEVRYHYEGLRVQAGGRGALGFQKIYTYDPQSGVETATEYHQDFPYNGLPISTTKSLIGKIASSGERFAVAHAGAKLLSESVNSGFSVQATELLGKMPYFSTTQDKVYEPNKSTLLSNTRTTTVYDSWGNVDLITVENLDANNNWLQKKITDNVFPTDSTNGFLGRLSSTTVTTQRTGLTDSVRKSSFEYHPVNKQIKAEIVEPDGTEKEYLRTEYGLDAWGNRTSTTVTSKSTIASSSPYYINRTSRAEYDTKGRFIEKKYHHFGQLVEEVLERNAFYAPTRVKGLNGVTLTTEFSTMGRVAAQYDSTGSRKDIYLEQCAGSVACPYSWHAYRIRSEISSVANTSIRTAPTSLQYFDVLGRDSLSLVTTFDGSSHNYIAKATEYDVLSRVKRVSLPYGYSSTSDAPAAWSVNTYDDLGRIILINNPDNTTVTTKYDGLEITYTNELSQTKKETRNLMGELIKVADAASKEIIYVYDIGGRLDTMTRVGYTDKYQSDLDYDKLGRKTRMWDADKSLGTGSYWNYDYNAAGEVIQQTDPRGFVTLNSFDGMGRLVSRIEKDVANTVLSNSSWTFDNGTSTASAINSRGGINNSRGQLTKENDEISKYSREPEYDNYGRVITVTTKYDASTWKEATGYDSYGRSEWSTDVTGQGVKFVYSDNGYLREKQDKNNNAIVYLHIDTMDHFGHITQETAGSGLITKRKYFPLTGRLDNITTTGNGQTLQNLSYTWQAVGNLESRRDFSSTRTLTESFKYDIRSRLTHINDVEYARYDDEGNITQKSDVTGIGTINTYSYGGSCNGITAGPHAVTSVENQGYCYDKNGNQLSGNGRTMVYNTAFDLPTQIQTANHTSKFVYGPSRGRIKREDNNAKTGKATTYYVGNVEVIVKGSKTEYRRNLGNAIVNNGVVSYLLTDHLGSTHRIVDCVGNVQQNLSFDAFGKTRNAETWTSLWSDYRNVANMPRGTEWLISPLSVSRTLHGFTGHEQMDEVGLIHMNGRIYDPHLGRFLQADPLIQAPTNSQSLNRYSYIINNPLSGVDPSGFSWWVDKGRGYIGAVVAIVISVLCYGQCTAMAYAFYMAIASTVTTYALTGSASGAFKAGAIAFATAMIGSQLGGVDGWNDWTAIGKHAFVGGVTSVLNGGQFGHGFVAAGITAASGAWVKGNVTSSTGRVLSSVVIGGTSSALSGGKFANGAMTAAFQAMAMGVKGLASSDETIGGTGDVDEKTIKKNSAKVRAKYEEARALAVEKMSDYCSVNPDSCDGLSMSDFLNTKFEWQEELFSPLQKKGSNFFIGASVDRSGPEAVVKLYAGGIYMQGNKSVEGLAEVLLHEYWHTSALGTITHDMYKSETWPTYESRPWEAGAFDWSRAVRRFSW